MINTVPVAIWGEQDGRRSRLMVRIGDDAPFELMSKPSDGAKEQQEALATTIAQFMNGRSSEYVARFLSTGGAIELAQRILRTHSAESV